MADFENVLISLRKAFADYNNASLSLIKKKTPDFNAFTTLDCIEIQLSKLIGELLDPYGSHAQGDAFLNLFADMFLPKHLIPSGTSKISLKLEQSDKDAGRIDILIDYDGKFGIGYENKPFASDLDEQISRYRKYMSSRFNDRNFIFVYLSCDGSVPDEVSLTRPEREEMGDRFVIVSYKQIREWCLQCAIAAKRSEADRLAVMIEEFAEYISRKFMGVNTMKNAIMGDVIEKHILEAFELNLLWQGNHEDYEKLWQKTINYLINEKLPELVFERLKEDKVINENWEWQKGAFDVKIRHLEGFKLYKKNWKYFKIGVISNRCKHKKGKRGFFPAIISKKEIRRRDYNKIYCEATGSLPYKEPIMDFPPIQWFGDFPDAEFSIWGYDQWAGINKDGVTVDYIAKFLAKLIKACEADINTEETRLQNI